MSFFIVIFRSIGIVLTLFQTSSFQALIEDKPFLLKNPFLGSYQLLPEIGKASSLNAAALVSASSSFILDFQGAIAFKLSRFSAHE